MLAYRGPKRLAISAGGQRHVNDMSVAAVGSRMRVKRVLEGGTKQHAPVVLKNVLRAIAMVHVKIHDGDPF